MTSRDHIIKKTCDVVSDNPSPYVTTLPSLILTGLVEMKYDILFCHVTSYDRMIKGTCNLVSGKSLPYVTILSSLIPTALMEVEV